MGRIRRVFINDTTRTVVVSGVVFPPGVRVPCADCFNARELHDIERMGVKCYGIDEVIVNVVDNNPPTPLNPGKEHVEGGGPKAEHVAAEESGTVIEPGDPANTPGALGSTIEDDGDVTAYQSESIADEEDEEKIGRASFPLVPPKGQKKSRR